MRSRLRTLLVGFLLLWLPMQGFAAGGMGYCRHASFHGQQKPADQHAAHHDMSGMDMGHGCGHDHAMQPDQSQPDPQPTHQPAHSAALCDDCSYCHLGTVYLPPVNATAPTMAAHSVFHPAVMAHSISFVPEQPQRPPLLA